MLSCRRWRLRITALKEKWADATQLARLELLGFLGAQAHGVPSVSPSHAGSARAPEEKLPDEVAAKVGVHVYCDCMHWGSHHHLPSELCLR